MTGARTDRRRWDTDEVGHGIGGGHAWAPEAQALVEALELPDWVAETSKRHLLWIVVRL